MADADLKRRLESLLFSSGRKIDVLELAKHCREESVVTIKEALLELQKELEEKKSSLMLIEEADAWKLTVREQYLPYVKKVVKQAELPKSLLETLAVVAFKAPALQSQIIKIRTNKAYRHLDELEKNGYIIREKKGRTKLIKLPQKFFDYFDLPPEKLKERFKSAAKLENAIETKEDEIEMKKQQNKEKIEEYRTVEKIDTPAKSQVEFVKEKLGELDVYETTPKPGEEPPKIGQLEVYEREEKKKKKKQEEPTVEAKPTPEEEKPTEVLEEAPDWVKKEEKKPTEPPKETTPSKGMFPEGVPQDVEKKIDQIVKDIVEPKEEKEEEQ